MTEEPPIVIGNEFASVEVRRVVGRNGTRLEIYAPRQDRRVHLDAVVLEALTAYTPAALSSFVADATGVASDISSDEPSETIE